MRKPPVALLILGLALACSPAALATPDFIPTTSAFHAYIDAKIIFSLEFTPKKELFLEVVNMGDTGRCLSIENISFRTEEGLVLRPDSFLYDGTKSKTEGGDKACTRQRTRTRRRSVRFERILRPSTPLASSAATGPIASAIVLVLPNIDS